MRCEYVGIDEHPEYTREHPREIIILAMGPSMTQCPYDCETWGLNMGYQQIATIHGRLDKIFMAHGQVKSKEGNNYFDWEHFKLMADSGIELINIHRVKGVPFKRFPLRRIAKKFNCNYFSDTIAYMVAYAVDQCTYVCRDKESMYYGRPILKYPLKLKLYGCDMQEKDEYLHEKGGVEYWLGVLSGLGGDFIISYGSTLLLTNTGYPYGFVAPKHDYYDPMGLMKGNKPLSPEEFAKQKDEIVARLNKQKKPKKDYLGERSAGLHREPIVSQPNS